MTEELNSFTSRLDFKEERINEPPKKKKYHL